MRLVNSRLLTRAFLQCCLGCLFFWMGMMYDKSLKCSPTTSMHPDHVANHPELIQAWDSGLKHKETFLLVIILSSPGNKERRNVIRDTWANTHRKYRDKFLLYFILGHQELGHEVSTEIQEEKNRHKDIFSLPLIDSYQTLTSKVLAALIQLNRNVQFKYLLKVDDDSYVQLPVLLDELQNSNFEKELYWGFFDGRAPVQMHGKWAEKEYHLCDRYIPYALGGGYVLSQDLVQYIAQNAPVLQKFQNEDISIGTWLGPLKIHRIHDTRFDTEFKSRGCHNKYLVSHKQSVEDFKSKHYSLESKGQLCEQEKQQRVSYEYNWNTVPSKCCIRNNTSLP